MKYYSIILFSLFSFTNLACEVVATIRPYKNLSGIEINRAKGSPEKNYQLYQNDSVVQTSKNKSFIVYLDSVTRTSLKKGIVEKVARLESCGIKCKLVKIHDRFWAKDNKHIIYMLDGNGDENWHLHSVDISSLDEKDITPFDGSRASLLSTSEKFPNQILALVNNRVKEYFDIYKIDIDTGNRELFYENKGLYSSFITDKNFNIRGGYKMLPNGEGEIYLFENNDPEKAKIFQKRKFIIIA